MWMMPDDADDETSETGLVVADDADDDGVGHDVVCVFSHLVVDLSWNLAEPSRTLAAARFYFF